MKAVGYVRMSTVRQDKSPEDQRREIEAECKRQGWKLSRVYEDRGISGDKPEQRPEFLRMLEDGAAGKFDKVVVWDQDRLGRMTQLEMGYYLFPLFKAGASLHTITSGPLRLEELSDRLTFSIKSEMSHEYLHGLAHNALRGMKERVLNEHVWTSRTPYGYRQDENKKLAPVPEEAPIVRRIFEMYADGVGTFTIANILNADGIPGSSGGLWYRSSIARILENRVYTGTLVWNRTSRARYRHVTSDGTIAKGASRRWAKADTLPDEAIVIPNAYEPIVSQELFDKCRRIRKASQRNANAKANTGNPDNVLRGLVFCSRCGSRMHYQRKAYSTPQIVCSSYLKHGAACSCGRRAISEDILLEPLVEEVSRLASSEKAVRKLWNSVEKAFANPSQDVGRKRKLEQKLRETMTKLERATERLLLVEDELFDSASKVVNKLKSQKAKLEDELEALADSSDATLEDVRREFDSLVESLRDLSVAKDREAVGVILPRIIERIDVDFEKKGRSWKPKTAKVSMASEVNRKAHLSGQSGYFLTLTLRLDGTLRSAGFAVAT